jgi:hypothetical protein
MNSGRNFSAFRKELFSHLQVKTTNMFLLVDLKFEKKSLKFPPK